MSEAQEVRSQDSNRVLAIVTHALFLAGIPTAHLAAVGAVILAYVQRNDARGTIWESHYEATITTFWTALVIFLIAIPLCFVLIGIPILIGLVIWVLYRTIRGLVHAIESKPY